jgi:excisionase family DNA binding protein
MPKRQGPAARTIVEHTIDPLSVRVPVAVRMTGIGRSKLYELIKAGEIEIVKVGTSTLVKVASLRRLIDGSQPGSG